MAKTIWVKSGRNDDRVVLWESDPAHPADAYGQHEVFVAGKDSAPVAVACTPTVNQKVRDGELVEVAGPPEPDEASTPPEPDEASTPPEPDEASTPIFHVPPGAEPASWPVLSTGDEARDAAPHDAKKAKK